MDIRPYLFFDGRCDEAIEFYRSALGAEVLMLMRFKDAPSSEDRAQMTPGSEHKVMHGSLRIGGSNVLVSDGQCGGKPVFDGFSLTITAADVAEAERLFGRLAAGGQVRMPMGETFFSPRFGMVADRFGVPWMVYVAPQEQGG